MLKPLLLFSAAIIFAIVPAPVSGRITQEAAPAQSPEPAQAAPPATQEPAAPSAPVKGPVPINAKNPVAPTAASLAAGKAVYNRDCSLCHGDNGNGKTEVATSMSLTLADWTNPSTLAAKQDGELFDIIRVGKGKMPAEDAGRAKDAEVWNLINYIRSLSKPSAVPPASTASK